MEMKPDMDSSPLGELVIDLQSCDLGTQKITAPAYDAAQLSDIQAARSGRSQKISIPATPRNAAIIGFARDPHCAERFNAGIHNACLSAEGAVLLAGTVRLLAASDDQYTLEIRDGGAQWATNAARRMFNTLGVDYRTALTPAAICAGWTDSSPVKFLPVHRDNYPQKNSSTDLQPAERLLSVDDYHPFLHVATLVKAIFTEAGYTVSSRFMQSAFFRSLYMSGAYAVQSTTAIMSRMGFLARRLAPATATANYAGRVWADPKTVYNSVGNIVQTATPQSVDADGAVLSEPFNNGGCFAMDNGKIVFTPTTTVSAGFEYYLKYTTDHRILSRTQLKGFDSVYLGQGADMPSTLANRYKDRRGEITTGYSYRVIVFNHASGAQYRLLYTRNGVASSVWTEFSNRSALVSTPAGGSVAAPVLQVKNGAVWTAYTGDWALYDGYIGETGQTTVELRVATAAERITPSSPKYFNLIYFYGAEEGMSITLHKECSLRVRFASTPGFGSVVSFADMACHRVRQAALLEALQQMFNLRFHTEQATRTVRIEPYDDFFGHSEFEFIRSGQEDFPDIADGTVNGSHLVDWRHKTDFSQPVILADIAPEVHENQTWGYMDGDGAVKRYNAENDTVLGEWSAQIDSCAAMVGDKQWKNPLFCPTLNSAGHYANAPSALIMQVGDRDQAEEDGAPFTPRIVRYMGMQSLPANERWGYPWTQASYPLAAFHTAGFSLCFENRDGQQGLHRYYDRLVVQQASRQRITISLRLEPHEYAALFTPGTGGPDIRSLFLLDTGQGDVRATLHAIEPYDPAAASVRCTFTRTAEY